MSEIALRQRVLNDMSALSLETKLFNETLSMPVALAPVGLTGMYARRGEVQAAMAADKKVFHLRFQRFLFARLRKLHLQLTVRCGSSFMCYVTARFTCGYVLDPARCHMSCTGRFVASEWDCS